MTGAGRHRADSACRWIDPLPDILTSVASLVAALAALVAAIGG